MATEAQHYYVPNPSPYPFILSTGLLLLTSGFVFNVNHYAAGVWLMLLGLLCVLYVLFGWFGSIIGESEGGKYKSWEDRSFRIGMIVFISSEVAFFAAFFGALFYVRNISVPELAHFDADFTMYKDFLDTWPSAGPGGATVLAEYKPPQFTPMGAWGIPAINTLILLSSGATVTWAHWGLLKNNRTQLIAGLFLTVALGLAVIDADRSCFHFSLLPEAVVRRRMFWRKSVFAMAAGVVLMAGLYWPIESSAKAVVDAVNISINGFLEKIER